MQISTRKHFQLCNLGWHLLYKHRFILACFPQHFGTQVFHGLRSRLRQDLLSANFTQHRSKTRISKTLYYFLGCHCIPSSVLGDDNPAPAADARLGECGTHSSPSEPGRRCPHHSTSALFHGIYPAVVFQTGNMMNGWHLIFPHPGTHTLHGFPFPFPSVLPSPRNSITKSVQFKGKHSASI